MQILSIMPLSTAGINNRQIKANTTSVVNNQNLGDKLSFQGRVFLSLGGKTKLIKPEDIAKGMDTLISEMQASGLSKKTIEEAREFLTGDKADGLKALSKQHQVDTLVSLLDVKGRKFLNFEVQTDSRNRKLDYLYFQKVIFARRNGNVDLKEPEGNSLSFVEQCRNTVEEISLAHTQKYVGKSTN